MIVCLIGEAKGPLRFPARTFLYALLITKLESTWFLIECTALYRISETRSGRSSIRF